MVASTLQPAPNLVCVPLGCYQRASRHRLSSPNTELSTAWQRVRSFSSAPGQSQSQSSAGVFRAGDPPIAGVSQAKGQEPRTRRTLPAHSQGGATRLAVGVEVASVGVGVGVGPVGGRCCRSGRPAPLLPATAVFVFPGTLLGARRMHFAPCNLGASHLSRLAPIPSDGDGTASVPRRRPKARSQTLFPGLPRGDVFCCFLGPPSPALPGPSREREQRQSG